MAMRPEGVPSRDAALSWVRGHAPDLEIQAGERAYRASFTFGGEEHTVVARGEDARELIAVLLWEKLRALQRAPVPGATVDGEESEDDLIRNIIDARARGDDQTADGLERALIALRTSIELPAPRRQERQDPREMPPRGGARQESFLNRNRRVY